MVSKAQTALENQQKFDGAIPQQFVRLLEKYEIDTKAVIDFVETQEIRVSHVDQPTGGYDTYVLRWNEGEKRFAITTAPLD